MVNALQNLSLNRAEKAITLNDIKYAASIAYLNFFPGKTEFCIAPS